MEAKDSLTITLLAEEWDKVLDVLGDGKYKVVGPLIKQIIEQAQAARARETHENVSHLQPVS